MKFKTSNVTLYLAFVEIAVHSTNELLFVSFINLHSIIYATRHVNFVMVAIILR